MKPRTLTVIKHCSLPVAQLRSDEPNHKTKHVQGLRDLMQLYVKSDFPSLCHTRSICKYVCGRSLKHFCLKRKGDLPNQSYSKRMFRTYTSARSGLVFIHSWELDVSQMQDWEPEAWLLETIPMMALAHFLTVAGLVLVVLMRSSQPQPTEQRKITSFITMTRYASKQSQQGRYSDEG